MSFHLIEQQREIPLLMDSRFMPSIFDGTKKLTRRPAKLEAREPGWNLNFSGLEAGYYFTDLPESGWVLRSRDGNGLWNDRTKPAHSPHGRAGDVLWLREAWRVHRKFDDVAPVDVVTMFGSDLYGVDYYDRPSKAKHWGKWRPSILMPRAFCRCRVKVVSSRLERLLQITPEDAIAEGMRSPHPRAEFLEVWDAIYGCKNSDHRCTRNPWIWRTEFQLLKGGA